MNKLSVSAILLGLIGSAAFAYDSDPGYGSRANVTTSRGTARTAAPSYYFKPTMRYYGKGYVVAYRFVQWKESMNRGGAVSYGATQHNLPATAVQAAPGREPRVAYYENAPTQAQAPAPVQPARTPTAAPAKEVPSISSKKP